MTFNGIGEKIWSGKFRLRLNAVLKKADGTRSESRGWIETKISCNTS